MLPTTIGIYFNEETFSIRSGQNGNFIAVWIIDMQEDTEEENIMMKTTDGFIVDVAHRIDLTTLMGGKESSSSAILDDLFTEPLSEWKNFYFIVTSDHTGNVG